ncbi:putative oxidoreductase CzcO [compost metagenome]
MQLFGRLESLDGNTLRFADDLGASLDAADAVYNRINASIDKFIAEQNIDAPAGNTYEPLWHPEQPATTLDLVSAGITSVIWCIGFQPDFSWVDVPVFNGRGYPGHARGVTAQQGLYFLGLPWLHTWGSGRFGGVARDAEYITAHLNGLRKAARHK